MYLYFFGWQRCTTQRVLQCVGKHVRELELTIAAHPANQRIRRMVGCVRMDYRTLGLKADVIRAL